MQTKFIRSKNMRYSFWQSALSHATRNLFTSKNSIKWQLNIFLYTQWGQFRALVLLYSSVNGSSLVPSRHGDQFRDFSHKYTPRHQDSHNPQGAVNQTLLRQAENTTAYKMDHSAASAILCASLQYGFIKGTFRMKRCHISYSRKSCFCRNSYVFSTLHDC